MSVAKNVVMGVGTLKNPRTVLDSVIVGSLAGHEHKIGERNIFIGNGAGFAANGTDNIYVGTGAGSTTQGSGNIILGPNILEPNLNNTFIVGQGVVRPIVASMDTGAVAIPHLEVGSLNVKGAFYANLPSNLVKTDRTNVGNVPCAGQYMVNFGTSNASEGYQSVLLGDHANAGTSACNVVAIGTRAAYRNTGANVIAIGKGAGEFNARDNMTYIGSNIECSPDTFTVKGKSANLGGWNLYTNDMSTDDIHITPEKIQFGSTTIEGTAVDNGLLTGPLTVKKHLPRMLETLVTLRKDGVYVGDVKVHAPFKELIRHAKTYYGLAGDGHIYTSVTGHTWRPIRSPSLEHITVDDEVLVGYGKGQFYRLEGDAWILEPRDGGHAYQCYHLCGGYALGTPASNSFYEDSGTVMYRAGQEWRLFPGVYPKTFTCIGDGPGNLYAGNEEGLYKLENRVAIKLNDDPVTFIAGRGYGTHDQFKFLGTQKTIKVFDAPLKYISKDQFAVTSEGVVSLLDSRVRLMGSGIVRAFGDRGVHKDADVTIPDAMRIGNFRISTNRGIELHDGMRTSKVYDTVHNPLPIHLSGIRNLTVKKSSCGGLEFEVEDEDGMISWIALGSLQSNGRSNTVRE